MPIEFRIDHKRRMVFAKGHGTLTDREVFGYQLNVWSRPEVVGYNELVDLTDVQHIELLSGRRVLELADLSASMDHPEIASKFAIVAPDVVAFGFGRMYESYRELNERSTKKVAVFRSMKAALEWLGIDDVGPPGNGKPADAP